MTRRKTPPLVGAEYVFRDAEQSEEVWSARLALIEATKTSCPAMLAELESAVLPHYESLASTGFKFDNILWGPRSPFLLLPEDCELKNALSRWADKFHARVGWLLDDALQTLRDWNVSPERRHARRWNGLRVGETVFVGEDFLLRFPPWEPQWQSWQRYKNAVREHFEKALRSYESQTRQGAESAGLARVQRTYEPENLHWLIKFQFCGQSSTKIANTSRPVKSESTILHGIKAAAKLTGWTNLRQSSARRSRKVR